MISEGRKEGGAGHLHELSSGLQLSGEVVGRGPVACLSHYLCCFGEIPLGTQSEEDREIENEEEWEVDTTCKYFSKTKPLYLG